MPKMNKQTAPAIRPERMFLRASFLSMWKSYWLELHVRHHHPEQQRQVEQREQVEPQRAAAVGAPVEQHRPADERAPERDRADQIEAAECACAERELRDRIQQQRVEQDLTARLLLATH